MILSAKWLVPVSSPYLEEGSVVVGEDKILDLGPTADISRRYPQQEVRNFPEAVLMPGFVNVHAHLELTALRGYLEGLPFWKWIQKLTRTKYQVLCYRDVVASALLGAVEAIRAGVTTIGDPMDLGASLEAVLLAGLRAVLYQEVFSPKPEEAGPVLEGLQNKLELAKKKIDGWPGSISPLEFAPKNLCDPCGYFRRRSDRVKLGVSPHAPYTVSAALFQKTQAYAEKEELPVCIHIAESEAESLLLLDGSGPVADSYRERGIHWRPPGCSPVQYLEQLGVIAESTLLVHCIRLEKEDYKIIRHQNASVAHCPKSNWKLGHGHMDLKNMRQHGIRLGLGSDSVASNNNMDLFEEMRFAVFNPSWFRDREASADTKCSPTHLTPEEVLRLATLGGAEALGMATKIGSIEKGKQADLIVVDFSRPHTRPVISPITGLVFSARASDVKMTMVDGEIVFENDTIRGIEEPLLYLGIDRIRQKLLGASVLN
jgi:cytosine/adenosine deaminase-related metal-dependent hydrolase